MLGYIILGRQLMRYTNVGQKDGIVYLGNPQKRSKSDAGMLMHEKEQGGLGLGSHLAFTISP